MAPKAGNPPGGERSRGVGQGFSLDFYDDKGNRLDPHQGTPDHPGGQLAILRACYEYDVVVVAYGRQSGKSTLFRFLIYDEGAKHDGYYVCGYMAQGHPQAFQMYDAVLSAYQPSGIVKRFRDSGQDRWIEFHPYGRNSGARIYFWSGDEEAHAGAAGKALNRGVIDEASLVPESAFVNTMAPMFNATNGRALIIGSPYPEGEGFDWFERAWLRGVDGPTRDPKYKAFNAPSESNPFASREKIALGRRTCPSKAIEQCQYDGCFSRDLGAVFDNLDAAFVLPYKDEGNRWLGAPPDKNRQYIIGIDWGERFDWTVISVWDRLTCEQVYLARFQGLYEEQLLTVAELVDKYNDAIVMADAKEVGRECVRLLRRRYGERVTGVVWAATGVWGKNAAVTGARVRFQNKSWKFLNVPWQREEFRLFSRKQLDGGGVKYQSPPGRHDDAVMSTLCAAFRLPVREDDAPTSSANPYVYAPTDDAPERMSAGWMDWVRTLNGPRRRGAL